MNSPKAPLFIFIFFSGITLGYFLSVLLPGKSKADIRPQTLSEITVQPSSSPEIITPDTGKQVTKIVDGDTFVLSTGQTVRLIGIDAPERNDCFSGEATQKLKDLILAKEIKLEKDVSETDRYQRLLRYVWVDQIFINDTLTREGFAKAYDYPPDSKFKDKFAQAEREAKENKHGLWGECSTNDKPGLSTHYKPGLGSSEDKDCKDFKTHAEAQAFFSAAGPGDPHKLDSDGDGQACEGLP